MCYKRSKSSPRPFAVLLTPFAVPFATYPTPFAVPCTVLHALNMLNEAHMIQAIDTMIVFFTVFSIDWVVTKLLSKLQKYLSHFKKRTVLLL